MYYHGGMKRPLSGLFWFLVAALSSLSAVLLISLYFWYERIGVRGSGWQVGTDLLYFCDVLFGSEVIVLSIVSIIGLIYGVLKSKHVLKASGILLAALTIIILPAAVIQHTHSYYSAGDGGPSGPEFDCLVWDNTYKYFTFQFEASCTMMHLPSLNTALINPTETYELEPGVGYFLTLLVMQGMLTFVGIYAFGKPTEAKVKEKKLRNKDLHN